jgi:hypothetical protein
MAKYINKISNNPTEKAVQEWFIAQGYFSLKRGWPDFCFWRRDENRKKEYVFVEVKRSNQTTIKNHQRKIKNIFNDLGLTYRVAFGLNEDGTPNFKEFAGINKPMDPRRFIEVRK